MEGEAIANDPHRWPAETAASQRGGGPRVGRCVLGPLSGGDSNGEAASNP